MMLSCLCFGCFVDQAVRLRFPMVQASYPMPRACPLPAPRMQITCRLKGQVPMQINMARERTSTETAPASAGSAHGHFWRSLLPLIVFVIFLLGWEALVRLGNYPAFLLP